MHDDTFIEGIYFRYKPVDTCPAEPGINSNWFCSNTIRIRVKKISVPGDLPFRRRTLCRFLYDFIILVRESECIIIKLLLELVHVSKGIFHGSQLILLPDFTQAFLCFRIRLVRFQEALEHFPIHKPALLNSSSIIASQKQSEEILKVPGHRMNVLAGQIFRADRKDDLIKTLGGAEMDAIHTCPSNDLGKNRGAKVVAPLFSSLESNM